MDEQGETQKLNTLEQQRLQELEQAFALFNQTSLQLTQAYESLQEQVAELQKQLEESDRARLRVAERLERLLTLLPAGVVVLDADNRIIEMNQSAQQILGHDALERYWSVVVRNVFLYVTDAQELIKHDKTVYQLSEKALDEDQGKIILLQDVTAARELQNHMSRHQRLESLGEMAASLAHQIRTPLSSALLYLSQMNSQQLEETQRQKFVAKSLTSLRHLESLVNDMLQYAKGGRTQNKVIEVNHLIQSLAHSLEHQEVKEGVTMVFQPIVTGENELPVKVLGDFDALITALQNLVLNAVSIAQEGIHIEVSVAQNKTGFIDLIVNDNGPGIEEALHEKIFEPFYTNRAKGTGLGLAVVRAVAEAHGGEAWVYSVPPNGARFVIRLPRYDERQAHDKNGLPFLVSRSGMENVMGTSENSLNYEVDLESPLK
ncbi:sensor histidine kinase [Galenea microaerophila]